MTVVSFDDVLVSTVGEFGRAQKFILFSISFVTFATALLNLVHVFASATPTHWCTHSANTQNESRIYNRTEHAYSAALSKLPNRNESAGDFHDAACYTEVNGSSEGTCSAWTYDTSEYSSTIVTEWDLVCDDTWLTALAQSLHMAGCAGGGILYGYLADRFGRRSILLVTAGLTASQGLLTAFSPNYIVYCILRLLLGLSLNGMWNCGYVLAVELVGPSFRTFAGTVLLCTYSLGMMTLAGLAYCIRDWDLLNIAISAPLVLFVAYYWTVPESPRWLLAHGRGTEAVQVMVKMAKRNGHHVSESQFMQLLQPDEDQKTATKELKADSSVCLMVKSPCLRLRTCVLFFVWLSSSTAYYGLSLYTPSLGDNDYVSFFLLGLVEIPAFILVNTTVRFMGRRIQLALSMLLTGAALLSTWLLPDGHGSARLVLSMAGKLCVSSAFAITYPYTVEQLPTSLRNVGLGVTSTGGKIGGFVSPYINLLGMYSRVAPLIVFGALTFIGGFLVFTLPETYGKALPETVDDAERMKATFVCSRRRSENEQSEDECDEIAVEVEKV